MANKRKDYHHNYYLENRERIITRTRNYREKHLGYNSNRARLIKIEVLTHYGGGKLACVVCGESRLACLSLDHIANNGAEDRRTRVGKQRGGFYFLKSIRDDNYPDGYQTLCMNCHFIKHWEKPGKY